MPKVIAGVNIEDIEGLRIENGEWIEVERGSVSVQEYADEVIIKARTPFREPVGFRVDAVLGARGRPY